MKATSNVALKIAARLKETNMSFTKSKSVVLKFVKSAYSTILNILGVQKIEYVQATPINDD